MKHKKQIKPKKLKKHFHMQCIQYIKKCSGGYIHPADTSWDGLAFAFECLAGKEHVVEKHYERCVELSRFFLDRKHIPALDYGVTTHRNERRYFYASLPWKKLRYQTLVKYGGKCQCCGSRKLLTVDHIKPISKYWELRLDPDNMQVLCNDCNWGKLNLDETDWRSL